MLKKLLGSVFVLSLALFVRVDTAHAALTLSANALTGDGLLTLQGTSLAVTGDTVFSGRMGLAGTAIDPNSYINLNQTITPAASTYGISNTLTSTNNQIITGQTNNVTTTAATGTTTAMEGGELNAYNSGAGTINILSGAYGSATNAVGGSVTTGTGVTGAGQNFGAGTVTDGRAFMARIWNVGVGTMTNATGVLISMLNSNASGTIGNAYGIKMSGWTNAGTYTNSYGLYMDTSIDRGSTSRYAIYSSSTSQSYLQGNFGIGNATPVAKLEVKDGHVASTQTTAPTESVVTYTLGTVTAGSTDTKGQFTVTTTGSTGSVTLLFNSAYPSAPTCVVSPASANTQADAAKTYVSTSTSGLTVNYGAIPAANLQTWNYICIQ